MIELVTLREYARRRGCTEGAVRKAVRTGRIALIDGKVDPVAADAQWARNSRGRAGSRPSTVVTVPVHAERPRAATGESYLEDRARRERAEADIAEMQAAKLRGELVRADEVRAQISRVFASLREAILQTPSRAAPRLIGLQDQVQIERILMEEHTGVLAQISEASDGRA